MKQPLQSANHPLSMPLAYAVGNMESSGGGIDLSKPAIWMLLLIAPFCVGLALIGHPMEAAVLGGIVALIAILISPLVGICLIGLSLPLQGLLQLLPSAFTASKGLAVIVALAFLPRILGRGFNDLFRSHSLRWYTLLLVWMLLLAPLSASSPRALVDIFLQAQLVGLAFLVATVPRSFRQLQTLCLWSTIGAGGLGVYIALFGTSALTRSDSHVRLAAGINENALAFSLGIGLILSAVAWYGASGKTKFLILVLDLLCVSTIGLTASRAVWLALAACVAGSVILARRVEAKHRAVFFVVASSLGFVGFLLVLGNFIGESGEYVGERFDKISSAGRVESIWPIYIAKFRESPVIGHGLGLTSAIGTVSHNDLLKIAAEQGLMGLLLFACITVAFFREAGRVQLTWVRVVMLALLVFIFVYGLFHNALALKSYAFAIGILACVANLGLCDRPLPSIAAVDR